MTNRYFRIYVIYTLLFAAMSLLIFRPFIDNGISFVWYKDGWTQHYKALYFYSDWLKQAFRSLIHDHRLKLDLYSFSLGYGSDVISTLHYYVVGDPICLLSALVPRDKMVYFYDFSFYLRFYLAGITYSLYCFYMKQKSDAAILAGMLLYCFPMFLVISQLRHPFFTNPFIYLPLLLLGAEKIMKKSSKLPFILAVFLSAVSNFYFFYMLVILTVIYVLIRLAGTWKENRLPGTVRLLLTYLGTGIIGTCLSCVVLLPVLYLFRSGARMQLSENLGVRLFYSASYYKKFFAELFTTKSVIAPTCICFLCLLLMFIKRGNRQLKAGTVILFIILLLPMGGRMMNGFSYASDRWIFGLVFLMAYIVTTMWEDLFACSLKEAGIMAGIFALCFTLMAFMNYSSAREDLLVMLRYVLLLAVCAGFFIFLPKFIKGRNIPIISSLACLLVVCLSIVLRMHFAIDPAWENKVSEYESIEKVKKYMFAGVDKAVMAADDGKDSFFRYGTPYLEARRNATAISGLKGLTYYWSLADREENDFFIEMGLPTKNDFNYRNTDDVTSLTDLASVKYYVIESKKGRRRAVPFGFEKYKTVQEARPFGTTTFSVYKNQYFLPFGYTYDTVIDDEQYEAMNYAERQNALLQGIHIPDEDKISGYEKTQVIQDYKPLQYHLVQSDGVEIEGSSYKSLKMNGEVTFELEDAEPFAATSLMINGISFTPPPEHVAAYRTYIAAVKIMYHEPGENSISSYVQMGTKNYIRYSNRHDYLVNMGYSDEPKKTFTIRFPQRGTYKIDKLTVYNQPMARYPAMLDKLRENVLEDISFENNTLSGQINLNKDKILCLSVPYSIGWKAFVNDNPARVVRANTMYMALPLKRGINRIRLQYCTPLLPQGLLCSIAGLMACILLFLFERRNAGKHRKKEAADAARPVQ